LQDAACSLHEQSSQVGITALAYTEQLLLASGGVFAWNQSNPGCELPAPMEGRSIPDGRDECGCCQWPNAGDRVQASAGIALLRSLLNQRIRLLQA